MTRQWLDSVSSSQVWIWIKTVTQCHNIQQPSTILTGVCFLSVFLFPRKCWQIIKNIKLGNCLISSCIKKTVGDRSLIIFQGMRIIKSPHIYSRTITQPRSWTYQHGLGNNIILTGCWIISFVSDTTYTSSCPSLSALPESFSRREDRTKRCCGCVTVVVIPWPGY